MEGQFLGEKTRSEPEKAAPSSSATRHEVRITPMNTVDELLARLTAGDSPILDKSDVNVEGDDLVVSVNTKADATALYKRVWPLEDEGVKCVRHVQMS